MKDIFTVTQQQDHMSQTQADVTAHTEMEVGTSFIFQVIVLTTCTAVWTEGG